MYNELTGEVLRYKINEVTSSWCVEALGVLEALKLMYYQEYTGTDVVVATDSKSVIASLSSTKWKNMNNTIVMEIKRYYKSLIERKNQILMLWIPGHEGIVGNEKADEEARRALESGDDYEVKKDPGMKMREVNELMRRKFQQWYDKKSEITGVQFKMLNEKIPTSMWITRRMNRRIIVTLSRIRCKHARYPVYLNRMGMSETDECECGEMGELNHVMLACEKMRGMNEFYSEILPFIKTFPINVDFLCMDTTSKQFKSFYRFILKNNIVI